MRLPESYSPMRIGRFFRCPSFCSSKKDAVRQYGSEHAPSQLSCVNFRHLWALDTLAVQKFTEFLGVASPIIFRHSHEIGSSPILKKLY